MRIAEVRAIVTGGASGLGLASAEAIVRGGGRVTLFDVNEEADYGVLAKVLAEAKNAQMMKIGFVKK